ncbi:MAG: hypothetical protein ABSB35_28095 [Bryobacteraceae bacterium]
MRSYGEYLAAEELQDKPIERVKELAFHDNTPVESWLNAITYLAEMNDQVRAYFARHHPTWLINVSPAAFIDDERTTLTRQLLYDLNQSQAYLVHQRELSSYRLARLLTNAMLAELRTQLESTQAHEVANALTLLGIRHQTDLLPRAFQLATAHHDASGLRYAAIIALINIGDSSLVNDLIAFTQPGDTYHMQLVDAIGSLCTPADFARVLPLLDATNAGLSATHHHFQEFLSKDAVMAAIDYLIAHPGTLDGYQLDAYLEPLIDRIPETWDDDIAHRCGLLLAQLERANFYDGKLAKKLIKHLAASDHDAITMQSLIASLAHDNTRLRNIAHLVTPLITTHAAQWIVEHANAYAPDLVSWFPPGPVRQILGPQTPEDMQAEQEIRERYLNEERQREQGITSTREQHQHTIRTARDINAIIGAAARLAKEHWPVIEPEQRDWLTQEVSQTLDRFDLATSVQWLSDNQWTHPGGLEPLLSLTDYYNLHLAIDVPIVLALRSWPDAAITNYYRKYGLSPAAQDALANLLSTAEHESITRNILSFLRDTGYDAPALQRTCAIIALDPSRSAALRMDATDRLAPNDDATLEALARDPDQSVQHHTFRQLIRHQHRPTISRALATLTDDELRAGETPIPESTPLDWIGDIKAPTVIDELRTLRQRTLTLQLWRPSAIVAGTIATIDKPRAAAIIRQQLQHTPAGWREHLQQEADRFEREARVEAAQHTPFDDVIKKLKGATSMIRIKVWCEGSTDRPVLRKLFHESRRTRDRRYARLCGRLGQPPERTRA